MTDTEATNPVSDEDVHASEETGVAQAHDGEGEQIETGDNPEGTADDESEELEHDGQKFRLPKEVAAAIKPSLMMHADYTRKTQQIAEERKAIEAARSQIGVANQEVIDLRASIITEERRAKALDEQIEEYKKVSPAQWAHWQTQDPAAAASAWHQYQALRDARTEAAQAVEAGRRTLSEKETAALETQRVQRAKQIEEGQAVLARDIKGWGPELAGKLADFAERDFGVSRQELAQITDPRFIKLLHRAYSETQAAKTKQAATRVQAAAAVKPTPKVGGTTIPPKGLDDRLSPEEWMRRRNEQVRAKRA